MKGLVLLLRWVVGLLFIFSGIVKTIDPIGFSIKLEEYFEVFNLHFLVDYALPLSIFFVILEVLLGVLLILGVWKRFTMISLTLLMIFFTFLTFFSAYFNKVTDCGCFGDAIKLTPWESFYKDIILDILIIFLWIGYKHIKPLLAKKVGAVVFVISLLICCYVAFNGVYHLPMKDFRPYAVGNNIIQGMKTAEELGLEPPQIEVQYHLKNTVNGSSVVLGEDEYVSNKEYWSKGSPWEIETTKEKVVKEGYEAPIHDFMIDCPSEDKTQFYLEKPKVVMIVTSVPYTASNEGIKEVSKFVESLDKKEYTILNVCPDNLEVGGISSCAMDPTTLKTMIRSNPGVVLLDKGTVKAKYNWHDIPTQDELKKAFD